MLIKLSVTEGPHQGRCFTFRDHDTFIVGRASCAHFRLPSKDKRISRVHFMVEVNPPHCRLMDADSSNGTYVNGGRVKTAALRDGDVVQAGQTVMRVTVEDASPVVVPPTIATAQASVPPTVPPTRAGAASTLTAPRAAAPPGMLPPDYIERIRARPQPIAGYQIVDELGRGGMGVVYLA
ncbi:MAG: FHA domain-containing protein, partial [Pirellulales bacterium]